MTDKIVISEQVKEIQFSRRRSHQAFEYLLLWTTFRFRHMSTNLKKFVMDY